MARSRAAALTRDPWFRRHPHLALTVAGVLYAAVLSLRMLLGNPVDAYSTLYALPVALVAMTFGLRAGAVAGLLAVGLTVVWAVVKDISLTPTGWASRVLPLLLLGVLLGHAVDRARRAEIEINDSLVQGMAAAAWSLDAGHVETGKTILDQTITQAHELVSGLIRRAGMGARTEQLNPPALADQHVSDPLPTSAADARAQQGTGASQPRPVPGAPRGP